MALGLALSGGGAKGAAHIGVLQALKEENINIDYISGTSILLIKYLVYLIIFVVKYLILILNFFLKL